MTTTREYRFVSIEEDRRALSVVETYLSVIALDGWRIAHVLRYGGRYSDGRHVAVLERAVDMTEEEIEEARVVRVEANEAARAKYDAQQEALRQRLAPPPQFDKPSQPSAGVFGWPFGRREKKEAAR